MSAVLLAVLLAAAGAAVSSAAVPDKPFLRAVWIHPGFFGPDKDAAAAKMRTTFDAYAKAGISHLIVLVKSTSGHVYFRSRLGAVDPAYASWDFLGVLLEEARKFGLIVQPWFCVFHETGLVGRIREHPEWLLRGPRGEIIGSANPALPEARAYEKDLMLEVARAYPVDWIHLDYIRFPCEPAEPSVSYDARTQSLFKAHAGVAPGELKAKDTGNMMWDEWLDWNADQVTRFVRELRDGLKALPRSVKISAAVFPAADKAKVMIGQDWAAWTRDGLLDMLCPMLYTNHAGFFEKYARQAQEIGGGRTLVLPGIGIGTSHNQNTPAGMMEQIGLSRRLGSDGVVFFSSSSLTEPFLAELTRNRD
jgi:uncharacterized lipoprotein YddW (UPF0748 family)